MADSAARVRVFSDDGKCVSDAVLMRRALEYVKAFDGVVAQHAQEPRLTEGAQMNEGELSGRLGLTGWPAVAEEAIIARDCLLAAHVGSRLHVCHVSTAGSVEIVRQAKREGLERHRRGLPPPPAADRRPGRDVRPDLQGQPAAAHARPTSRRCAPGWPTARSTSSPPTTRPHPHEDKDCEWAAAAFGMLGLETALSIVQETMVDPGLLDWAGVAERMSYAPARIGRVGDHGRPIAEGAPGQRRALRPVGAAQVEASESASLSRNTPYAGMELPGRVVATFLRGRPRCSTASCSSHHTAGGILGPVTDPRDWLLTATERGNPSTRLDDQHPGRPGVVGGQPGHAAGPRGVVLPRSCYERARPRPGRATWCSSPTGRATPTSGSPASPARRWRRCSARADERGVDVRGLVWRSHLDQTGFFATREPAPRRAAAAPGRRGAAGHAGPDRRLAPPEVRGRPPPRRPDAATSRSSAASTSPTTGATTRTHRGDPQPQPLSGDEYGATPPWHDVQVKIQRPGGPRRRDRVPRAVGGPDAAEPQPVAHRSPTGSAGSTSTPDPLPEQAAAPAAGRRGTHTVQLLRTYPNLRHGRDFPFARGGERSVARGYTKALERARRLVYVEDQYFWGHDVGDRLPRPRCASARDLRSSRW